MAKKKTKDVVFNMQVMIKGCPLILIDGEKPGTLATQQLTLKVPVDGAHDWIAAATLNDFKREFMESVVEVLVQQLPEKDKK